MIRWRYLDATGAQTGASDEFHDSDEAESWLTASWAELRERGIQSVELVDDNDGSVLYRMELAEG
ncbi:MAG: hypothetical protein E6G47_02690 [Actinobacteria bacterium]|nr:MAG: hypothetical protein E6G47_02690 [Actinomycetota bacterium]